MVIIMFAVTSCRVLGNQPENHFAGTGKMVEIDKAGSRDADGYPAQLSIPSNSRELRMRLNSTAVRLQPKIG